MTDIIENIRNETDVFSKAKLINHILKQGNLRLNELAKKLSMTSSYLCHLNRLNKLPDIVVDGYYSRLISISHLFLISRVSDVKKLIEIYEKVLSDNLTVKQTEDLIRETVYEVKNKGNYIELKDKNELIRRLKNKISDVETKIVQTRTRGKIFFEIKGNLEKTTKLIKEIINKLAN